MNPGLAMGTDGESYAEKDIQTYPFFGVIQLDSDYFDNFNELDNMKWGR